MDLVTICGKIVLGIIDISFIPSIPRCDTRAEVGRTEMRRLDSEGLRHLMWSNKCKKVFAVHDQNTVSESTMSGKPRLLLAPHNKEGPQM